MNGDKSATRLLNRNCVNKKGLYLSKEVLWASVGQMTVELPAIKVEGLKKNSAERPGAGDPGSNSLERSKPLLLTQTLSKRLAALLRQVLPCQNDTISYRFVCDCIIKTLFEKCHLRSRSILYLI